MAIKETAKDWYKEMHGNSVYGNMSKGVIPDDVEKDTVVESVLYKYKERSSAGIKKYNTTLDRNDLSYTDWLNHLQEELMDATLYIEKLLKEIK
tara:strand:+ start:234 stop:515 length:282 start_codon:yes stop_codon:yes gene_type:complete